MTDATLGALALRYVNRRKQSGEIRPSTAGEQRIILINFAHQCRQPEAAKLKPTDIDRYLATIAHLAPGTRHNYVSVVKGFCAWLVTNRLVRRDPTIDLAAPKVPRHVHRALEGGDAERILAACHDNRDRLLVTFGLQLGLRRAEIAGLEVGDIHPGGTVTVRGKGGHHRMLPLTAQCRAALSAYLAEHPTMAGPLLRQYDRRVPRGVSPDWVGRRFRILAYGAGVKTRPRDGVGTHSMRHTAASDVYTASRDVLAVADLLGHANLANTQRYVRGLDVERLREVIEGRDYGRTLLPEITR